MTLKFIKDIVATGLIAVLCVDPALRNAANFRSATIPRAVHSAYNDQALLLHPLSFRDVLHATGQAFALGSIAENFLIERRMGRNLAVMNSAFSRMLIKEANRKTFSRMWMKRIVQDAIRVIKKRHNIIGYWEEGALHVIPSTLDAFAWLIWIVEHQDDLKTRVKEKSENTYIRRPMRVVLASLSHKREIPADQRLLAATSVFTSRLASPNDESRRVLAEMAGAEKTPFKHWAPLKAFLELAKTRLEGFYDYSSLYAMAKEADLIGIDEQWDSHLRDLFRALDLSDVLFPLMTIPQSGIIGDWQAVQTVFRPQLPFLESWMNEILYQRGLVQAEDLPLALTYRDLMLVLETYHREIGVPIDLMTQASVADAKIRRANKYHRLPSVLPGALQNGTEQQQLLAAYLREITDTVKRLCSIPDIILQSEPDTIASLVSLRSKWMTFIEAIGKSPLQQTLREIPHLFAPDSLTSQIAEEKQTKYKSQLRDADDILELIRSMTHSLSLWLEMGNFKGHPESLFPLGLMKNAGRLLSPIDNVRLRIMPDSQDIRATADPSHLLMVWIILFSNLHAIGVDTIHIRISQSDDYEVAIDVVPTQRNRNVTLLKTFFEEGDHDVPFRKKGPRIWRAIIESAGGYVKAEPTRFTIYLKQLPLGATGTPEPVTITSSNYSTLQTIFSFLALLNIGIYFWVCATGYDFGTSQIEQLGLLRSTALLIFPFFEHSATLLLISLSLLTAALIPLRYQAAKRVRHAMSTQKAATIAPPTEWPVQRVDDLRLAIRITHHQMLPPLGWIKGYSDRLLASHGEQRRAYEQLQKWILDFGDEFDKLHAIAKTDLGVEDDWPALTPWTASWIGDKFKYEISSLRQQIQAISNAFDEFSRHTAPSYNDRDRLLLSYIQQQFVMIHQLLRDLDKKEIYDYRGEPENIELNSELSKLQSGQNPLPDYDIQLALSKNKLHVLIDTRKLTEIITNLLRNVSQAYGRPHASIVIRTAIERHKIIGQWKVDKWATVEVEDKAGGIPESVQSTLFELGTSTKGSGIGLFVVRRIVEAIGGKVGWTTQPGIGTIIDFRLPLQHDPDATRWQNFMEHALDWRFLILASLSEIKGRITKSPAKPKGQLSMSA